MNLDIYGIFQALLCRWVCTCLVLCGGSNLLFFVQHKKWCQWHQGEIGVYKNNAIGRVYNFHLKQHECFYLRLFLHQVKGPKWFADLRLFDSYSCPTYREACMKHVLHEDDDHLKMALTEAAECRMSQEMGCLFCYMLLFSSVREPLKLWKSHKNSMSGDILCRVQARTSVADFDYKDEVYNEALIDMDKHLKAVRVGGVSEFNLLQFVHIKMVFYIWNSWLSWITTYWNRQVGLLRMSPDFFSCLNRVRRMTGFLPVWIQMRDSYSSWMLQVEQKNISLEPTSCKAVEQQLVCFSGCLKWHCGDTIIWPSYGILYILIADGPCKEGESYLQHNSWRL